MTHSDTTPKRTPFSKYHEALGAKMVDFVGFYMPVQYKGITSEHLAVRQNVGLFDLSHMGEFEVTGKDALAFLQKTTTNNVATLEVGKIQYSCMPYPEGGIVDDLLVYRLADRFFLVVNASNIEKDFNWLKSHLFGDAKLVDRSDEFGLLAIQGPNAQKVMAEITSHDLEHMGYYTNAIGKVAGVELLFSRTGYTGEDGFELYIPPQHCDKLWKAVTDAGKKYGMEFIGLGARDSLRLEMKMALYGNDIDQTTTPVEAGLSWIVDFEKDFIGKPIMVKQRDEKPTRRLVCLEMEGKVFPRHGYDIYDQGKVVGKVTSGTFSPSLQKPIAMGYVPLDKSKIGATVNVAIRDKQYPAVVVKPPFYKSASHR
ncbi:glycine cleavage system protein T [candidate division GN15 bacterium]|uniref:Aminomethyltransferase n=1 Tax=candidate division GN15 bacterium TaxID=2072418 RepID=A0A855X9Q7_9BACT|nr:MAG: glycine cleavage system protein T [candidate division GN15 bacterium]